MTVVYTFPLGHFPWSLAHLYGLTHKESKADFSHGMQQLERHVTVTGCDSCRRNAGCRHFDSLTVSLKLNIPSTATFQDITEARKRIVWCFLQGIILECGKIEVSTFDDVHPAFTVNLRNKLVSVNARQAWQTNSSCHSRRHKHL